MDDEAPSDAGPGDAPASQAVTTLRNNRKWVMGGMTLIVLLCAAGYAAYWAVIGRFEERTDDAYVGGNVVPLMARVNGTVIAIRADNTQRVTEGQPLVLLDRTDARDALDQSEALLAQAVRQVQRLYQTAAQQEANVALQKARLVQSTSDYQRDRDLVHRKFVSAQDFQNSGTRVDVDRASLEVAEHELAATRAAVANTELADHPEVRLAAAHLRDDYVALQRTTIPAPVTGYVDKRSVQIGGRVSPGTALMAIVPLDQVWVDANFKESQLRHIRIGQPVRLTSDEYGGEVVYRGRVLGLGAGTGSAFALLPPQNATGNWIKVVQRVPVRVALDAGQLARHPLRISLSMEVTVDTHDRSGAALRDDAQSQDAYATSVYQDEAKGAQALIERIIGENTVGALRTKAAASPARIGTPRTAAVRYVHDVDAPVASPMTAGIARPRPDTLSHD